jgi:hypothetical protein
MDLELSLGVDADSVRHGSHSPKSPAGTTSTLKQINNFTSTIGNVLIKKPFLSTCVS